MTETSFETNLWVVVTPGHTYGPFLTEAQAADTPVGRLAWSVVRLMTEADSAALDAQEGALDELDRQVRS